MSATIDGIWIFNSIIDGSLLSESEEVNFTTNNIQMAGAYKSANSNDIALIGYNSSYYYTFATGDDNTALTINTDYDTWDFGTTQTVTDGFYNFLTSNATRIETDPAPGEPSQAIVLPATVQMIKDLMSGKLPIEGSSSTGGTDGGDEVTANPELTGEEEELTGLEINGVKYKISAVEAANAANTKSDNAVFTANAASTKADNAVFTANAANTAAEYAASTADSAAAEASAATQKVNELAEQIGEKQGTSVTVDGVAQATFEAGGLIDETDSITLSGGGA